MIVGAVNYMSPEQARGAVTDFRSDQFSFGLILHEMAHGRPAFRRDTPAATLDAIINDELPPMAARDARIPVLRWVIERRLAKDPDGATRSRHDLHRDLKTLRTAGGSREPGAAAVPATMRTWRRPEGLVAILAAGVMLRVSSPNRNRATDPPWLHAVRDRARL
jgi:serine/threonine protein kinase